MANGTQQYHVNGEAIFSLGVGSSNALVVSGYSESGIRISIMNKFRPIFTDVGGSEIPAEYQDMGAMALIEIDAPVFTENYMRAINTRAFAADGTTRLADGAQGRRGQLVGTQSIAFALAISGSFEDPWYFPTCISPDLSLNLGTDHLKKRVRIQAWPFVPGSAVTVSGVNLFARAIP